MSPDQSKYGRWKYSVFHAFPEIFAVLSSALLAHPTAAGIKWTKYCEYGSCVHSYEEKLAICTLE